MKVVDILGWNIFLSHSHINVTPFCGNEDDYSLTNWHRDLRRVNDETTECNPAPMISAKVSSVITTSGGRLSAFRDLQTSFTSPSMGLNASSGMPSLMRAGVVPSRLLPHWMWWSRKARGLPGSMASSQSLRTWRAKLWYPQETGVVSANSSSAFVAVPLVGT